MRSFNLFWGNIGEMCWDKVLKIKVMKLGNEILLQNYHEQVISVVDRAKKLSEAELVIKFSKQY